MMKELGKKINKKDLKALQKQLPKIPIERKDK